MYIFVPPVRLTELAHFPLGNNGELTSNDINSENIDNDTTYHQTMSACFHLGSPVFDVSWQEDEVHAFSLLCWLFEGGIFL